MMRQNFQHDVPGQLTLPKTVKAIRTDAGISMQRKGGLGKLHKIASLLAYLLALAILLAPMPGSAQSDSPPSDVIGLTLKDAVRRALEYNRPLINQRSDRKVQRFSLEVSEDRWTPQFAVRPFASTDRQDRRAGVGAETSLRIFTGGQFVLRWDETLSDKSADSGSQTLSFSQPLLKGAWPGIETASFRQQQIQDRVYALALRKAVEDLIVQVSRSYRALIAARRQVEIAETALRRAEEQLQATRSLIRAGRVAQRETVRSETTLANRELALTQARNRLDSANFDLIGILELDSTVLVRPLDELKIQYRPDGLNPALEEVLRLRPDFLQARLQVETAKIALEVARNDLLPDLSLGLEWNRNDTGRTDTQVRVDANFPLTDRVDDLGHVRAKNDLRRAERNLAELRESIGIEVRQTVNDVEVGLRLTELARRARELAAENLAVERKKFSQGLASSFEVAAAEDDLVQTEQSEVTTIIGYLDALTRLDQVSGRMLDLWNIRIEEVSR
ncbi:MAG: TolC family protein [Proteobacteria bacterium]|nr:TolC family protein [Pseudomonadota bacterium]